MVTLWALGLYWKHWQPDEQAENRLERALFGSTGGMLLVWAYLEATAKSHIGNTQWDRTRGGWEAVGEDIVVTGPDLHAAMAIAFVAAGFLLASVVEKESK